MLEERGVAMISNLTVLRVYSAVRIYNQVSETLFSRRKRNRWAMVLKNTGATEYYANGKCLLSDKYHPVILPKGCSYSWKCIEEGECLLIEFDALETDTNIYNYSKFDTTFFVQDFYRIQAILQSHQPNSGMDAIYKAYGILLQLLGSDNKEYTSKDKKSLLEPAVRHLDECYQSADISNDMLASLCGISTVYFRKSFESIYGLSPIRYLHRLRMQKAKEILASDYDSVSQVAISVGYSNLYHFSKMFKTYTGMSPTEYAKASRK